MNRYAENTEVSVEKTRAENERLFVRYGANRFASAVFEEGAAIAFQYKDKQIRFTLPLPNRADKCFWFTPDRNSKRTAEQAMPNGSRLVGNDGELWR
jgi:hypothetical protein